MTNQDLGYNESLEKYRIEEKLDSFETGRVISEHKERYTVKTPTNEFDSELIGNLRFTAESRYDFPAVGDWVAFSEYDKNKALIHAVFSVWKHPVGHYSFRQSRGLLVAIVRLNGNQHEQSAADLAHDFAVYGYRRLVYSL